MAAAERLSEAMAVTFEVTRVGWPRWRQRHGCSGKRALLVAWVGSAREEGVGGVQLEI